MWALLRSGVDTEIRGRDGIAPLHCAARLNGKVTEILLQAGASVDIQDCSRKTHLHWAAYPGCVDSIEVLLRKGAYGGARDDYGRTPLHLAAVAGWEEGVKWMMMGGNVERNSIDQDGRTPLHLAAMGGTEEVLRSLLGDVEDRGEDQNRHNSAINATDNNRFSPFDLAVVFGYENAVRLFLERYNEVNDPNMLESFALASVLTKGFSPQAIGTKICTRLTGLGTEPISPLASGLVWSLFPRQPRAWYGDYFSAILGLGADAISAPSGGLVRKVFPHEPRVLISAF